MQAVAKLFEPTTEAQGSRQIQRLRQGIYTGPQLEKLNRLEVIYLEENTYEGVYLGEIEKAMLDYKTARIYQSVLEHLGTDEITTINWDVIDSHSWLEK